MLMMIRRTRRTNLDVRNDTSFELSGDWGIRSTGLLFARGGEVLFDGSRGWRGTLMLGESAAGPIPTLQRDDGVLAACGEGLLAVA